jgi:hypothetical protein
METSIWAIESLFVLRFKHNTIAFPLSLRDCGSAWSWNQKEPDEDGEVDENDYWYMGKIPPMGANVAFSLYGHLKSHGGTFKGCDQNSFINSFYTRAGFTAFTNAMQSAGVSGFSSYDSDSFSADCQGGYGVGCDASGGFASYTYSSSLCDPQTITATTNQLSNLNKAMESVQCIKIFDTYRSYSSYSSSSSSSSNSNDDAGGDDGTSYDGTPLALLDYSSACFYQNVFSPDGDCPDPFGKIAYYKANFYKDIQKSKAQRPVSVYKQKLVYEEKIHNAQTKMGLGLGLLAIAGFVLVVEKVLFDHVVPKLRPKRKGFKPSDYADEEEPAETVKSSPSDADDHRFM